MACDIIFLKISFENSINLGGENTHLNSTLETRDLARIEAKIEHQQPDARMPFARAST